MMSQVNNKILFLTRDTWYTRIAINFLKTNFKDCEIIRKKVSRSMILVQPNQYDYIIALGYQHIIPNNVLELAKIAAINFHPGSTMNPGAGAYSYPLFHDEETSGVTCHHMTKKPDTGKVIMEKTFRLYDKDTFRSLKYRTLIYTLVTFYEIIDIIIAGDELPTSREQWKRRPRLQKQFEKEVLEISIEMSTVEIDRRIRAANPDYPGPFIEINGKRYTLRPEKILTPFIYGK